MGKGIASRKVSENKKARYLYVANIIGINSEFTVSRTVDLL